MATKKKPKAPRRVIVTLELETERTITNLRRLLRKGERIFWGRPRAVIRQCQVNVIRPKR